MITFSLKLGLQVLVSSYEFGFEEVLWKRDVLTPLQYCRGYLVLFIFMVSKNWRQSHAEPDPLTTVGFGLAPQDLALQVSIHCIISVFKFSVVLKDNLKKALMELW